MSSAQQFLVICGLFLLGGLILNLNQTNTNSSSEIYDNEAVITGTGIGQSMLNQIMTKAFDEKTVKGSVSNLANLTPPGSLGKDPGESIPTQFDDIDDYDNYSTAITVGRLGNFNVSVHVYYVSYSNPDLKSLAATFLKRIDVTVTNPLLADKLVLSQLISY